MQICPRCQMINPDTNFFCSKCGRKLKEPPVSTSLGKQIVIYLVSFFLPPFGLGWAFSYIRQPDGKAKIIGWVTIFLTVLSLVITVWVTMSIFNSYAKLLSNISSGNVQGIPNNANVLQELKSLQ